MKAKDKMFFGEKEEKNEGGKGNARKGGEWQWVSKTETLPPSDRARVEGGGWVGQRSLKVTGAGAVDGIDRTIWREESRCGFQSRRHEREIIPSSTPHHRTACRCRTHFYSPVRLWGRGGAEPKRRTFLPKGLFDSPFSSSAAPSQVPPLHSADRDRWESDPKSDRDAQIGGAGGKMQTHVCATPPPPSPRHPACVLLGRRVGGLVGWGLAILWQEPINLECAALGPGRVRLKWAAQARLNCLIDWPRLRGIFLRRPPSADQ